MTMPTQARPLTPRPQRATTQPSLRPRLKRQVSFLFKGIS